jgi:ethanolamine ammonia-lyase small subunit
MSDAITQAQQIVAEANAAKQVQCAQEINAVLKKHGCVLVGTPVFTQDGRVAVQIQVIAGLK